jgi:hypothetical protein
MKTLASGFAALAIAAAPFAATSAFALPAAPGVSAPSDIVQAKHTKKHKKMKKSKMNENRDDMPTGSTQDRKGM